MTNRKIDGSSDVLGIIQQSRPMRTDCAEFLPASEVPPGARAAAQACSEVPDVAPTAFPRMIRTGLWGNGLIREDYQVLWVGGYSRLGSRLVGPCGFFWLRYLPLQFVVPASTLGSFPGLFNSVACQGVVSVR